MLLPWFGGARGVQELSGILVLRHPAAILSLLLAAGGIVFSGQIWGRIMAIAGCGGLCTMELYYFLTWYLATVHPQFSFAVSFAMAYPAFYLCFGLSVLTLAVCLLFLKKQGRAARSVRV